MMSSTLLHGAIDVHVHAAPSLFERWGDADDLAWAVIDASMGGFVLKSHHGSSVEHAAATQKSHPSLHVRGGLVLNHFVGGLNPHAVEAAVNLGARVVWLPTVHAEHHRTVFGSLGDFGFQQSATRVEPSEGISLLDAHGASTAAVHQILDIIDGTGVVLATGHVSPREISVLHREIRGRNLDIDLLVNHVRFVTPALESDAIEALADERTWLELCSFSTSMLSKATTVAGVADLLRSQPTHNWIISSDAGQAANIAPPEALATFAHGLVDAGVSEDLIHRALVDHPRRLLGLEK